jgi:hypothetical protein
MNRAGCPARTDTSVARSVRQFSHDETGSWWAYVWDQAAARDGVCPDAAMRFRAFETREEAERWCEKYEREVVTRYRARCAWEARLPAANPAWLEYYRLFNADQRVIDSGTEDPDEATRIWIEAYDQGG